MYQSVFFNRQPGPDQYHYYLRDDQKGIKCFQYFPTVYKIDDEGEYETLFGDRCTPVGGKYDRKDPNILEKDISKELVLLRDLYYKTDDKPTYHNIVYLDIEIEILGPLNPVTIKEARAEITAIALMDANSKEKICFILDKENKLKEISSGNKQVIPCSSEKDLIKKFLSKWEQMDPTIVVEYNGSLDKLFKDDIDKYIDYNIRDVEIIEALEEKLKFVELTVLISHLCHTPYESIYYNTELNEGAILTYLKRKNIIAPNKPTTTNPSIKELEIGDHVTHQRNTPTVEGIIYDIKDNLVTVKTLSNQLVVRYLKTVRKKDSYAGGYLLDPKPGLYSDISDLDFTSLYPSIIKSLNLGIETLMGRIITKNNYEQTNSLEKLKQKPQDEIISIQRLDKKTYKLKDAKIKTSDLIELIEENKWSISASGAFYRTDIKSIACEVLEDWFDKREHYRVLKKTAGKAEDWANYKLYDLYQMAFKILQNALYGTYAVNSWRFTDGFKICSAAITNSGQRLTIESIKFVNQYISDQLGKEPTEYVRASDTDSLYMELTELLLYRNPDLDYNDRKEKINRLLILTDELQEKSNENLNNISQDLFNITDKHYFVLKQEVIAEKAYWAGKRRYAMYIVNKEGIEIEELEMKGLDIMKSNFPPLFKNFGEELLKNILFGKSKTEIDEDVMNFKDSLKTIDWKQLLKPTGLKKLDEYIERKPTSGELFSKLKLKCPVNTKAAIATNDILRFKKLNVQYPEFSLGDKMYIAMLKPNPYQLTVVGLNGYNDAPEILEIVNKYIDRDGLFDSIIRNKLENLYQDLGWSLQLNEHVSKFFNF